MNTMKAKYKGCFSDTWKYTELRYEYRGYDYLVTKYNNGYMAESLRQQHEEAQRKIDEKIAHQNDAIPEWTYEGSAEEGFDVFFDYVTGE